MLRKSSVAIQEKMHQYVGRDDFINNISLFIDCNCLETSRIGGGPMDDGANSRR